MKTRYFNLSGRTNLERLENYKARKHRWYLNRIKEAIDGHDNENIANAYKEHALWLVQFGKYIMARCYEE
ncbi:MAG: hypothetical protein WC533_00970 [Candidatus Pacearchaeota archaeon]